MRGPVVWRWVVAHGKWHFSCWMSAQLRYQAGGDGSVTRLRRSTRRSASHAAAGTIFDRGVSRAVGGSYSSCAARAMGVDDRRRQERSTAMELEGVSRTAN